MNSTVYCWIGAALGIVIMPLIPGLLRLRIRILRRLRWHSLADLHEKYFDRIVIIARIVLVLIIAILVYLGIRAI